MIRILTLMLAIVILVPNDSQANQRTNVRFRKSIISAYEDWKKQEINQGNYAAKQNCNPKSVYRSLQLNRLNGIAQIGFSKESLSFADINNDRRVDALILFKPKQCDGGNAFMNAQTALVVLSKEDKSAYTVDSEILSNLNGVPSGWWLTFEALQSNGIIIGTAQGYSERDARCCPSLSIAFEYKYPSQWIHLLQ